MTSEYADFVKEHESMRRPARKARFRSVRVQNEFWPQVKEVASGPRAGTKLPSGGFYLQGSFHTLGEMNYLDTDQPVTMDILTFDSPDHSLKLRLKEFWSHAIIPAAKKVPTRATEPRWKEDLDRRLEQLREAAEDEVIAYNDASERDLREFLLTGFFRQPAVFLLGNGNLRAVWENNEGEQVGLQFLGESDLQFVLFRMRQSARLSHSAGRDTADGVIDQIRALKLGKLVFDE